MVKVFISYKLREGVSRAQYREWSSTVDQPMASRQPGVLAYEIYEIDGSPEGSTPFDIVEVIEAESWEAWQAVNERPEMKEAVEQFWAIAAKGTVTVTYGRRVPA